MSDHRGHIDPDYQRWGRKYGRFPGVAECVRLLRSGNMRGSWIDIIIHELAVHADDCLPELIAAFRNDENEYVRLMVLSAITEACLPTRSRFWRRSSGRDIRSSRRMPSKV
jgi:hypothetical protein